MRRARPEDAARICDLHVRSIRELTGSFYTPGQISAWSKGRKPSDYRRWMRHGLTMWVAELSGQIAGFAASSGGELHLLYVHPRRIGRGVASALLEVIERHAVGMGVRELVCPASLNAVAFYRRRGFQGIEEGSLLFGEVPVPHIRMRKRL